MTEQCDQCGECTKVCPIMEILKESNIYNIFTDENFDLWNCCSCFLCEQNCPKNLSVRDEIFRKRCSTNLNEFPLRIKKYFENIKNSGFVFPMDEFQNMVRKKIGLKELALKKIGSEIKKILSKIRSGATT